jgi:hypothetical protein
VLVNLEDRARRGAVGAVIQIDDVRIEEEMSFK